RAGGHAELVDGNLAHAAARAQLHLGSQRVWPICDVNARLGPLRATGRAMTEVDALGATAVFRGCQGNIGRPPVPAEIVQRPRLLGAGSSQWYRRHGWLMRGISRIARDTGDAHHAV